MAHRGHAHARGPGRGRVPGGVGLLQRKYPRLGHAYDLPDEQHLTQSAYERGITIERHPLGAFAPPLAEQGIYMMLARGILVSICSDDPALYRQTLTQNLQAVFDHYSWGKQELQKLTANALVGAFFATPLQQKRVLADFVAHGLDAMLEERRSFQSEKGGES